MRHNLKQFLITPAAGKRLIAKALVKHPSIIKALKSGTVAIIAGTTNGYVAEEILADIGQIKGFSRKNFFRGLVLPPGKHLTRTDKIKDENKFPGDVITGCLIWCENSRVI